jgi:hypothetical protein
MMAVSALALEGIYLAQSALVMVLVVINGWRLIPYRTTQYTFYKILQVVPTILLNCPTIVCKLEMSWNIVIS